MDKHGHIVRKQKIKYEKSRIFIDISIYGVRAIWADWAGPGRPFFGLPWAGPAGPASAQITTIFSHTMTSTKIQKAVLENLAGLVPQSIAKSNYDKMEKEAENRVAERLNAVCEGNLSASILIMGSKDRDQFIDKVIQSNKYLRKSPVVYISGLTCQTENQAMFQIADAFLLRNNAERNPNVVLEDLEIFFRVSIYLLLYYFIRYFNSNTF